MLQFKPRQPEPEDIPSRWNIGVDRRNVISYIGLALIAGLAAGFLIARSIVNSRSPAPPPATEASLPSRQAGTEGQPFGLHRVTRIVRADTLDVENIGLVRMLGIETPDGKSPRDIYGIHGQRALSFVEKALLEQEVRIESDPTASGDKDESGQVLAYVYTQDGTLINGEMVKQGLALVRPEPFKLANDFRGYEREAMQAMRGVWGSSSSSSTGSASAPSANTSASSPQTEDKPRKLSPMPPSALGANIPAIAAPSNVPGEQTVWLSSGDRMYHKSGCEFLDKKKHSVNLSQAKAEGYAACSRCYASTVLKAP